MYLKDDIVEVLIPSVVHSGHIKTEAIVDKIDGDVYTVYTTQSGRRFILFQDKILKLIKRIR